MNLFQKLGNWYFNKGALPYWCILMLDCGSVFMTGMFAYYIKHGGMELTQHFWPLVLGLGVSLVIFMVSFFAFHTFRGVMRYSSFVDLRRLAVSNALACMIVCLLHQLEIHLGLAHYIIFPRVGSAILIFFISTMIMWSFRIVVKIYHDTYHITANTKGVFIYGSVSGGIALAKSINNAVDRKYVLSGFISNDPKMDGTWLVGVRVYADNDEVVQKMKDRNASVLLVSPIQAERFTNRTSLIDALIKANIKIMMMPQAEEWDGKSDLSHNQLKEVEIEDLLPRQKIEVDLKAIGEMLKGKRILITGAAGSIGSEISRQVAKFSPAELVLIDQAETPMHDLRLWMNNFFQSSSKGSREGSNGSNELNSEALNQATAIEPLEPKIFTIVSSITDEEHMEKIFSEHNPEYVFHAAAYKHVPMMEDNPGQAVRNNVFGTRVIADLAVKYGTKKFVMISTDKAVNPTNVMGCSKRICEIYCQALNSAVQQVQNSSNGSNAENGNIRRSSNIPESKGTLETGLSDNQTGGVQVRQSLCSTDSSISGICDGQHSGGVRETREQGVQELLVHSEGLLRRTEESSDESSRCELHNGRDLQSDVCGLQETVNSNSQLHQESEGFGVQRVEVPVGTGSNGSKGSNGSNALSSEALIQLNNLNQLNCPSGIEPFEPAKLRQIDGSLPVTQFITTRFGNVLGSNGSVIPIFREQIKKGGPVKVTHPDIIRYFMLIPEACRLVLEAGIMGHGGEIFVFDMGEPVKIVDLARRMIALSGAKDVKIEFSGLRDGEKLYEELLATKENTKPTHHPKIMVAEVREYPYDLALKNEIELYELSQGFDDMAIVKKMKEIVPEYKSQNSKYSELD